MVRAKWRVVRLLSAAVLLGSLASLPLLGGDDMLFAAIAANTAMIVFAYATYRMEEVECGGRRPSV